MINGLNDLLLVAEEDITWLGDAAKRFEGEASQLDEPEKSTLGLLAAVYRERAEMHQALVEKLRNAERPTKSLGKARTAMRGGDKKRHADVLELRS